MSYKYGGEVLNLNEMAAKVSQDEEQERRDQAAWKAANDEMVELDEKDRAEAREAERKRN